jgi:hypothetical protein
MKSEASLVVLPAIAAVLAFGCVIAIGRDALRRVSPDRVAWMIAFGLFGVAATAEVVGDTAGWNELLVRLYYVSGAVLVVGFLALGQLYLLAGRRISRFAPGVALFLTAVSVSTVWGAPIDAARLDADGWDALTRTPGLKILAISVNSIGTLILLGGLVYSAIRFKQRGTNRNRMIGCLLIAGGTLTVAMGGTLTRLGSDQYLYIAMSAGIGLIFSGYLWTKRPDSAEAVTSSIREISRERVQRAQTAAANPAIGFIEGQLLAMADDVLAEECRVWSVPSRGIDAFSRSEARRVWSFRTRLSPAAQTSFDARPADVRLQLVELYFDVLNPDGSSSERAVVAPIERIAPRDHVTAEATTRVSGSVD